VSDSTTQIEQYYDDSPQREWERLERHRTEFAVTSRVFIDTLPTPPASILDVGSGPGRYALLLAERGYSITLVDLSQKNLDFAHHKADTTGQTLHAYVHANATDLSAFPSDSFDAVLLMGPLYHLGELEQRQQALREAYRVLKPNALLFAAFITRNAPFRTLARLAPSLLFEESASWQDFIQTGVYKGYGSIGFTASYFAYPTEIRPLLELSGFEILGLQACEGIVGDVEERINALSGEHWQAWVDLNVSLGKDPSVLGAAYHLLAIGRKVGV
jgi:ubiquinone/menaquinone biosynthesis C-methylase UbiE